MSYIDNVNIDGSQDIQYILMELANIVYKAKLVNDAVFLKGQVTGLGINLTAMPSLVWLAKMVKRGFLINDKLYAFNVMSYDSAHGNVSYTVQELIDMDKLVKLDKGIYSDRIYLSFMSVGKSNIVLDFKQAVEHSDHIHQQLEELNKEIVVYAGSKDIYIFNADENYMDFLVLLNRDHVWHGDYDGDTLIGEFIPNTGL